MKEELITFQTAKLAKEKGLVDKEFSINYYLPDGTMDLKILMKNPDIKNKGYGYYAPTQALLQKWLREVHNIHVEIKNDVAIGSKDAMHYSVTIIDGRHENKFYPLWGYNGIRKYEEALDSGLHQALQLI